MKRDNSHRRRRAWIDQAQLQGHRIGEANRTSTMSESPHAGDRAGQANTPGNPASTTDPGPWAKAAAACVATTAPWLCPIKKHLRKPTPTNLPQGHRQEGTVDLGTGQGIPPPRRPTHERFDPRVATRRRSARLRQRGDARKAPRLGHDLADAFAYLLAVSARDATDGPRRPHPGLAPSSR